MTYFCHACRSAPLTEAALIEHIQTCEKHPLAAALRANAALSEALREVVASLAEADDTHDCGYTMRQLAAVEAAEAAIAAHGVVWVNDAKPPQPPPQSPPPRP